MFGADMHIAHFCLLIHENISLQQKAQLPLREQGVSLVHSSHRNAPLEHLAFLS